MPQGCLRSTTAMFPSAAWINRVRQLPYDLKAVRTGPFNYPDDNNLASYMAEAVAELEAAGDYVTYKHLGSSSYTISFLALASARVQMANEVCSNSEDIKKKADARAESLKKTRGGCPAKILVFIRL